jgi:hypothetical protein
MNISEINETNCDEQAIEFLLGVKKGWCMYMPKAYKIISLLLRQEDTLSQMLLTQFEKEYGKDVLYDAEFYFLQQNLGIDK